MSADLIVMGTHRKQLLRDVFVGTTLGRVIRVGAFPVLLVNKEANNPYSKVIAAVDLCEPSERAVRIAKSVGLIDCVERTLLHAFVVSAKNQLYIGDAPDGQMTELVAAERRRLRDALEVFLGSHKHHGSVWNYRIEEGDAQTVISGAIQELRPELLVIGTHGRPVIAKLLLGSVAEAVLRSLDVDILVVPSRI
jgi:universal stress protein E